MQLFVNVHIRAIIAKVKLYSKGNRIKPDLILFIPIPDILRRKENVEVIYKKTLYI